MTETSIELLFGRLANFRVDIERLREHYETTVRQQTPTQYRDNEVNYVGWAVTSRDGSLEDGVKRISPKSGGKRGRRETGICTGYLKKTLDRLVEMRVAPYRVRLMRLETEGLEMPWHSDAKNETWRLHIPIITNPDAVFQWKLTDTRVEEVHLPADGSAWLVRVDILHRAINLNPEPTERVHLLMGFPEPPHRSMIEAPTIEL